MSNEHDKMIERAVELFQARSKSTYGVEVIRGERRWSGADKSKRYGEHYAKVRRLARQCVEQAGGFIVPVGRYGKLETAILSGADYHETRFVLSGSRFGVQRNDDVNVRVIEGECQ